MNRVFLTLAVAAFAFLGAARADAADVITELCPAYASPPVAVDAASGATAATTFSYDLEALTPSIVSGTLAVQTDKGWYLAPFARILMGPHADTFTYTGVTFTRTDMYSDPQYVRFDVRVSVQRAYVMSATTDDTTFPWPSTIAPVSCEYAGAPLIFHSAPPVPPVASSAIAKAKPTKMFDNLPCATPFADPSIAKESHNDYVFPIASPRYLSTGLVVEIDERGIAKNVWTYSPSAVPDFDKSSLEEARGTHYNPAISRCLAVPSLYLWHVSVSRPY